MRQRLRSHLTYANVMATVAVFLALGGGAYAVSLKKNSVGSKQLKPGAVKASDLGKNSVSSEKVADRSLLGVDFAGQLPQGPAGPPGEPGKAATNLFAYIADQGDASNAFIEYGNGVTEVVEKEEVGRYWVSFNRSLANCVVSATAGLGYPLSQGSSGPAAPRVLIEKPRGIVDVLFLHPSDSVGPIDTSFLISAFC
jgi:hypothetical protein